MNVLGAFGLTRTSATSNLGALPDWPEAAPASRVSAPAHMKDRIVCISGGSWSAFLLDGQTRGLGGRAMPETAVNAPAPAGNVQSSESDACVAFRRLLRSSVVSHRSYRPGVRICRCATAGRR